MTADRDSNAVSGLQGDFASPPSLVPLLFDLTNEEGAKKDKNRQITDVSSLQAMVHTAMWLSAWMMVVAHEVRA